MNALERPPAAQPGRSVIVLAHRHDGGALAVVRRLQERGTAVQHLLPEALAQAAWSHRVSARGLALTQLRWPDGRQLCDNGIGCLWNRALYLPQPAFAHATPRDRDYAAAELQALVLSWFGGLGERCWPNVRQAPSWAAPLPQSRWQAAARALGLPLAADAPAEGCTRRLLVVGGAVIGLADAAPAPDQRAMLAHALPRLAQGLGLPMLEVHVFNAQDARGPALVHASAQPALREPVGVAAVAVALERAAATAAHGLELQP